MEQLDEEVIPHVLNCMSVWVHDTYSFEQAMLIIGNNCLIELGTAQFSEVIGNMCPSDQRLDGCEKSMHRFRVLFNRDTALLREGRIEVTVYYRTTDEPQEYRQNPDTPWPDLWCGSFMLRVDENGSITGYEPDTDVLTTASAAYVGVQPRLTNISEFPETWELAQEKMRYIDLYLPGTNVPREEVTEAIYNRFKADLPRKQLF